jgi:hypothetical protein
MNPWRDWSIDHVVSVIDGGSDDIGNLVGCCKQCNSRKHGRPLWAWVRQFPSGFADEALTRRAMNEQPDEQWQVFMSETATAAEVRTWLDERGKAHSDGTDKGTI